MAWGLIAVLLYPDRQGGASDGPSLTLGVLTNFASSAPLRETMHPHLNPLPEGEGIEGN